MAQLSANQDYYTVLQVSADADFKTLKKAYYRRAKECHPDLHNGCSCKEEEFKLLVEAFDVLSDPITRREFDARLRHQRETTAADAEIFHFETNSKAIMDTLADDILEELIVGNTIPRNTTLQTLMLDLENTERFCLFREAKTCYYAHHYRHARALFERAVKASPSNIIYRYYLGKTLIRLKNVRSGRKELEAALQLGAARRPPQRLRRIRHELSQYRDQRQKLLARWHKRLFGEAERQSEVSAESMRQKLGDAIMKMQKQSRGMKHRKDRPQLPE